MISVEEIYKSAVKYAQKHGKRRDEVEEFPAYCAIKLLEKGEVEAITMEWWWIDFLRKRHGSSRSSNGRLRQSEGSNSLDAFYEDGRPIYQPESDTPSPLRILELKDPEPVADRFLIKWRDKFIADMLMDELDQRTIGYILGVTDGLISQIVKRIRPRIEASLAYNEKKHERDLEVKWITLI